MAVPNKSKDRAEGFVVVPSEKLALGGDCHNCPLAMRPWCPPKVRNDAKLVILGESPGSQECAQGTPFVGESGRLIKSICESHAIPWQTLHVTNAMLCQPSRHEKQGNLSKAVACCRPRLEKELANVQADRIAAMGSIALRATTDKRSWKEWGGVWLPSTLATTSFSVRVMGIPHPTFVLRGKDQWFPVLLEWFVRAWTDPPKMRWPRLVYGTHGPTIVDALSHLALTQRVGLDIESTEIEDDDQAYRRVQIKMIALASRELSLSVLWPPEDFFPREDAVKIRALTAAILRRREIAKVCQNGGFDITVLARHGLPVYGYDRDTIPLHSLTMPGVEHNLSLMSAVEFHVDRWKTSHRASGNGSDDEQVYNARDAFILLPLLESMERFGGEHLPQWGRLRDAAFGAYLTATLMLVRGISVNEEARQREMRSQKAQYQDAMRHVRAIATKAGAPKSFNPSSKRHLALLFFKRLKMRCYSLTETGQAKVDKGVLKNFLGAKSGRVRLLAQLLLKAGRHKARHDALKRMRAEDDGLLHVQHVSHRVISGRWGTRPNIQNLEKDKFRLATDGKRMVLSSRGQRHILRARPDCVFVWADHDAQEVRTIAAEINDEIDIAAFKNGESPHVATARALFGRDIITPHEKTRSKNLRFGLNYGGAVANLHAMMSADTPGLRLEHTELLAERYLIAHPRLRLWHKWAEEEAKRQGFVQSSVLQRRFWFHQRVDRGQALNFRIQATGADLVTLALIEIADELDWEREAIIVNCHDEIVLEGPDEQRLRNLLERYMHKKNVVINGMKGPIEMDYPIEVTSATCWRKQK